MGEVQPDGRFAFRAHARAAINKRKDWIDNLAVSWVWAAVVQPQPWSVSGAVYSHPRFLSEINFTDVLCPFGAWRLLFANDWECLRRVQPWRHDCWPTSG